MPILLRRLLSGFLDGRSIVAKIEPALRPALSSLILILFFIVAVVGWRADHLPLVLVADLVELCLPSRDNI